MSEAVVAKRYAEALFQLGEEKDLLDKFVEEFGVVQEVFQENQQLYTFLKHPRITNEKKKQFLQEVFQGLQQDVVNTIKLLVERHRLGITPSLIDYFTQMVNDVKGIAEAIVYSARSLSEDEKQTLEQTLATRLKKEAVKLTNIVDETIIGGLNIQVGNTIFDGSIRGKLTRIERSIVSANK